MHNMLIVAVMVVSCILTNRFISASEITKVATTEETKSSDQSGEQEKPNEGDEEEEEESN